MKRSRAFFDSQARAKVDAQLAELQVAPITDEEFFGGRLYTGPLFEKYNAVLRGLPTKDEPEAERGSPRVPFFVGSYMKLCQGNRYVPALPHHVRPSPRPTHPSSKSRRSAGFHLHRAT